jgi:hypothetical protein
VRENTWYDAGQALGARRSDGYFSEVFHYPINSATEINTSGAVNLFTLTSGGSAYTNGTYALTNLTGGTGTGAIATITVAGGIVTTVLITSRGSGYSVNDILSASIPAGSGFLITLTHVMNYVSLWQHEIGTDAVQGASVTAIESYFETNDLGLVSGGPAQASSVGDNVWLHVERVEPDFVMTGNMELYVTGRPFAQSDDATSAAYVFDSTTTKIDLREQRRELRLKFVSNVQGGNYQLGRLLLNANVGDVRPY